MNEPFPCDMTRNNERCPGKATHVMRTAHNTRIICDDCAFDLRRPGTARMPISNAAVEEFTLLELIPARASLLCKLKETTVKAEEAWDRLNKLEQAHARGRELIMLGVDERRRLDAGVIWGEMAAAAAGLGVVWGSHDWRWGMMSAFGASLVSYVVARWLAGRWAAERLREINARYGGLQ